MGKVKSPPPTDLEEESPQTRAAPRWKAVEAFNGIPGLSPAARRVGIALICAMDGDTRDCFPGELRLSGALDLWPSAIKKAKADLLEAGLINWTNPHGPRGMSVYTFNWDALMRYHAEAKARSVLATQERKFTPAQKPPQRTLKEPHQRSLENENSNAKDLKSETQSPQNSFQSPHQRIHNDLSRGPEHTQLSTQLDIAQHITPSQADGGLGYAEDSEKPFVSQQVEPRRALEGRKKEPPKPLVFFPQLVEVLGKDNPKVTVAISRLGWDQQKEADLLLATKGDEAALAYIQEHDPKGMAA